MVSQNPNKSNSKETMSENTIIGANGTKVKVLFQALHMTCVIFALVYNLKVFYFGLTV
jgi:hypothetical protein